MITTTNKPDAVIVLTRIGGVIVVAGVLLLMVSTAVRILPL